MVVVPVLTASLEAQNESRLCRWQDEFYTGREKARGLILDAYCTYLKISHLPSLSHVYYVLEKGEGGLFSVGYVIHILHH